MKYMLRRNVVKRDWYNGIDKYDLRYGRTPECVAMNRRTFYMLVGYVYRFHNIWHSTLERRNEYAYARDDIRIAKYDEMYFEGVKIYINEELENEVVRFW